MAKPTELERRIKAAQATLDRFKDKPFRFGHNDCARMVAFHLRKLGHQVKLPPSGSYRSAKSALIALKARGFTDLAEAMDGFGFERIPPAAAAPGDVLLIPGEGFGGALQVAIGNGRTVGYHQDAAGAVVLQPVEFVTAWRITPPLGTG